MTPGNSAAKQHNLNILLTRVKGYNGRQVVCSMQNSKGNMTYIPQSKGGRPNFVYELDCFSSYSLRRHFLHHCYFEYYITYHYSNIISLLFTTATLNITFIIRILHHILFLIISIVPMSIVIECYCYHYSSILLFWISYHIHYLPSISAP